MITNISGAAYIISCKNTYTIQIIGGTAPKVLDGRCLKES